MTAPLREASVRRVAPPGGVLRAAAALAGVTLVTVNPAYQAGELAHVLGHFSARAIFVAEDHRGSSLPAILATVRGRLPELREVIPFGAWDLFCASGRPGRLPAVDPGAPAQVLYTSGTTGRPKAAVLTHRGLTNNARLAAEAIGMQAGETVAHAMPLFHVAGLTRPGLSGCRGDAPPPVRLNDLDPDLRPDVAVAYPWRSAPRCCRYNPATRKARSRDWLRLSLGSQAVSYRWPRSLSAISCPPPMHSVTSSPVNSMWMPPG